MLRQAFQAQGGNFSGNGQFLLPVAGTVHSGQQINNFGDRIERLRN